MGVLKVKTETGFEAIGGGGAGKGETVYVIKGLTEMESHLPPFTEDEYTIAYNNGLLIHNTIRANSGKYKTFAIPTGIYPVCYQYGDGTGRTANGGYYIFNLADGVKLDMQGAELWVMYDSDNRSPYDSRTDTTAHKFGGWVVGLADVRDVEICNGKITGERELRSFANSAENRNENTTGICMVRCCFNVHIHDMDINSFMGDSISANSIYGDKGGYYESAAITMETLTTNGAIGSASPMWGHTDMTAIPAQCIGVPTYIWTGIGYNYVMSNHFGMFVYLYDDEETFITSIPVDQSEPFVIKESWGATKYRLYIGIGTALTSIAYRMTTECSNKVLIEDCKFTNNNRGGISNMPISAVIQRCMFDNCGSLSYGGKPQFYDSTRYCIDIEDIASQDLTVRDCKFTNSFHGILSGAINAVYDNNTFVNCYSSISIYRGKYIKIVNNRIYNCKFPNSTTADTGAWNAPKVVMANNSGVVTDGMKFYNGWSYSGNQFVANSIWNDSATEVNVGHSANVGTTLEGRFSGHIDLFDSPNVNRPLISNNGLHVTCKNGALFKYANAGHIKNVTIDNSTTNNLYYYNASETKEALVVDDCVINALEGKACRVQHYSNTFKEVTLNNCTINLSAAWYKLIFGGTDCNTNLTFNNCTLNWIGITENVSLFEKIEITKPANTVTFNNCKFTNDSTEFTVTVKSDNPNATYTFNDCVADDTVVLE